MRETRTGPPPETPLGDGGSRPDRMARALLAAALLLACLRFWRLGEWSLWIDEAFTLADALHGGPFRNPLGYWLFEVFLAGTEGRPTEFQLRLLPAVVGWLCVPLTWWAFRTTSGDRAASAAALFVAISSWHLYWSQNARFYTLAMAISLVGAGLALRGLRRDRALALVAGLAIAGTAALAHPTAALVLPGLVVGPLALHALGLRVDDGTRGVRLALGAAVVLGAVAFAIWGREVIRVWSLVKGAGSVPHLALTTGFYVTPLLGIGALVGASRGWRARHSPTLLALLVVALGLGAAFVLAASVRVTAQYVFLLLPWIALLAAEPLAGVRGDREPLPATRAWPLAYASVLAVPALATCVLYMTVRRGERPQWREAYAVVADQRRPGDLVLGMAAPVGEYYLAPARTDLRRLTEVVYLDRFRADVAGLWDRGTERVWFVVNREEFADWPRAAAREVEDVLRDDCRLVAEFPLFVESRDLSVSVFLRD